MVVVEGTRASDSKLPRFRNHRNAGRDRVQIDVRAGGQERFVIKDRDTLAHIGKGYGTFAESLVGWVQPTISGAV